MIESTLDELAQWHSEVADKHRHCGNTFLATRHERWSDTLSSLALVGAAVRHYEETIKPQSINLYREMLLRWYMTKWRMGWNNEPMPEPPLDLAPQLAEQIRLEVQRDFFRTA